MKSELKDIKFTLTKEMAQELLNFNTLKKEYINKKQKYEYLMDNSIVDNKLEKELECLIEKLELSKKKFITLFQIDNKEEINKYINFIDKNEKN